MNIIYILTTVLIITLYQLLYKKDEKQNFLKSLSISLCMIMCYNIVICVFLTFIKIKSTLITLSLINIIIGFGLIFKILKDKKIQKYFINKIDIIAIICIIVLVSIIAVKQYGIPINIKHAITDASIHYFVADEFYNYSMLLLEENSDVLNFFNEDFFIPGAYINTGILFKIFSPIVDETYFCKLFVIFDISMWCLSGLLMYSLLSYNKKQNKHKILPLIFSLVYMLAYPLNTLLSGFSYLQIGLNIIICIILIMKQEVKNHYKYIQIFLLNFGLMFTYYYFAPVVFLAVFLQIIIEIKKQGEKIFSIKNILNIFVSVFLPGLFGLLFFIVLRLMKLGEGAVNLYKVYENVINTPGSIYINFITNILIYLPLSVYYIANCIKNKKQDISNKMLIITIVFMIILFIGMKMQKISEYYYYKVYYMLWIYIIVTAFYATEILKEKAGLYFIAIIISVILNNNFILFDIYKINFQEIQTEYKSVTDKELKILEYYNNNIDSEDDQDNRTYVYLAELENRARWIYAITRNPYIFIDLIWGESPLDIQQFIDSDKQYCMILKKDTPTIFENIEENANLKILLKNEDGAILEKIP